MKAQDILYTQRLDEQFKFLDYTMSKLKGLFGDHSAGRHQTIAATRKVLSLFQQAMGRRNQSFQDVTWGTLIRFLSNPSLLGFNINDVMNIVKNEKIKFQVAQDWDRLSGGTVELDDSWGKKDAPIGGPSNDELSAKLAEIVVNYIVEFASVEYLERRLGGGSEGPDEEEAPAAPTGPAPTGPAAASASPELASILSTVSAMPDAEKQKIIQQLSAKLGSP